MSEAHRTTVNTIKALTMDAVQAANSGHPGMPMGAADMATVLWSRFLKHDPADPAWPDRDRFVLSAGHGSMLIYSLLHLSGYDLSLDDLKAFRQWGSRTPGHPEFGHTPGVETTTGPLGQGLATAVGMAIAERLLRETFGAELCDHHTWVIAGDGCLMEGISYEASSLAGHLGLGRLIVLYDDNTISIDGSTDLAFTEDRAARFAAQGWHVQRCDGHDPDAVADALAAAKAEEGRPSLILARTVIGQGSAKQGSEKTHGAPLGADDVAATKARLGLDPERTFHVPDEARAHLRAHGGPDARAAWQSRLDAHPRKGELLAWLRGDVDALDITWPAFPAGKDVATRKASKAVLDALVAKAPWVVGGSADLAGSNGTDVALPFLTPERFEGAGRIAFGVREHAMGAIANGLALHGGVLPYVATFLIFHDYMRPAVRLSALMGQRVVYVYTHDSIFLGEDGPTHQPVETLSALRTVPGLVTFRPADAVETVEAWKAALARTDGPTALVLSRQNLPTVDRARHGDARGLHQGGYVLRDVDGVPDLVLVATGSEVPLALATADLLGREGTSARVVSMPSPETFRAQPASWRHTVVPPTLPVVTVEAGVTWGWEWLTAGRGASVGIDRFGASAPAEDLATHFGFTPEAVAAVARTVLAR